MKKNYIIGICCSIFGFALGSIVFAPNVKYKTMVENAREECIEYNREYNKNYNTFITNYFATGGEFYKVAASILQNDFPYIMAINKSLNIDCREYDENGEVVMIKGKNGDLSPMEELPNEIRIMK